MTRRVILLLLVAAACTTRRHEPAAAAASVEVRSPGGDLLLAIADAGDHWELHENGVPTERVERTPEGAVVKTGAGATVAELATGPVDKRLVVGDKTYRVAFTKPRRAVVVLDPAGAVVIAYEQTEKEAVARDSTTRQIGRARKDGDKIVVEDGLSPAAVVTHLESPAGRELAALVIASPALPPPARAALFAHILSR